MFYRFAPRSQEWLSFRLRHITATEAASFVGVYPYVSARKVLENKEAGSLDKVDNEAITKGLVYEGSVADFLRVVYKWPIFTLGDFHSFVFEKDGLSSTPDFFVQEKDNSTSILEAKTTSATNFFGRWVDGRPPEWYLVQTQVQLYTTGLAKSYLVCLVPGELQVAVIEQRLSAEFIEFLQENIHYMKTSKASQLRNKTKEKALTLLKNTIVGHKVLKYSQEPDGTLDINKLQL